MRLIENVVKYTLGVRKCRSTLLHLMYTTQGCQIKDLNRLVIKNPLEVTGKFWF